MKIYKVYILDKYKTNYSLEIGVKYFSCKNKAESLFEILVNEVCETDKDVIICNNIKCCEFKIDGKSNYVNLLEIDVIE